MQADEARVLLGFPPNSRPTPSQIKAAYKKKVWETHPDRFPVHEKSFVEYFRSLFVPAICHLLVVRATVIRMCSYVSELQAMIAVLIAALLIMRCKTRKTRRFNSRTGVPTAHVGRRNHAIISAPFLFIILGTVALGGLNAARAYKKQLEEYPSHNPFLP